MLGSSVKKPTAIEIKIENCKKIYSCNQKYKKRRKVLFKNISTRDDYWKIPMDFYYFKKKVKKII